MHMALSYITVCSCLHMRFLVGPVFLVFFYWRQLIPLYTLHSTVCCMQMAAANTPHQGRAVISSCIPFNYPAPPGQRIS